MPSHRTYPVQVSPICPATDNTQSQVHSIRPAKEHTQSHFSSHMDHRRTFSVLPFHSTWPAEECIKTHLSSHMASQRTPLLHFLIVRAVTLTRSQSIFIMMSASIHITFMFSTRPYALQDVPPVRHHPSTTSGDPTPSTPPTGGSLERGTERAKPGPFYPPGQYFCLSQ